MQFGDTLCYRKSKAGTARQRFVLVRTVLFDTVESVEYQFLMFAADVFTRYTDSQVLVCEPVPKPPRKRAGSR